MGAGDRCRVFGKGPGFPLQNPFKLTKGEPDPREGTGNFQGTRGAPRGAQGWREVGRRDERLKAWREGTEDES